MRCRSCSARANYIKRYGKPAEMASIKCEVCGESITDYASNHVKGSHRFCSADCRAAWVGVHNSISRGGDGIRKSKSDRDRLYYRKNVNRIRGQAVRYYRRNRSVILTKRQQADRRLKAEIIAAYGGKCECCGEAHHEFLTIDHVNGDGAAHRRALGGKGRKLYAAIKAEGFPKDRYRLLCLNCNISLGFYGYCPHHPERRSTVSHVPFTPGRKRTVAP